MRLSEAIRLGSMLKPQAFGPPGAMLQSVSKTCALAAAAEAIGLEHLNVYSPQWQALFKPTTDTFACPVGELVCHGWPGQPATLANLWPVVSVVAHLNDHHHWTREQIADWVETIEAAQTPITEPQPAETTEPVAS